MTFNGLDALMSAVQTPNLWPESPAGGMMGKLVKCQIFSLNTL